MPKRLFLVFGILIPLFVSPAAQAEEAPLKTAQEHYIAGRALYQEGKIKQALVKFEGALRLVTRPSIILSIAQCHRQLNNRKLALKHYRFYLSEWQKHSAGKPAPFLADVEQNIKALEHEIKAEENRIASEKNSTHQRALLEQRLKNEAQQRELGKVRQRQQAEAASNAETRRSKTIWAYTALGVAVASLATGGILIGVGITQGDSAYEKYENAGADEQILQYRGEVQGAEKMMVASYALMGVGAVSLGISLYQFFTRPPEATHVSQSERSFSFDVGPGRAQVHWKTRF